MGNEKHIISSNDQFKSDYEFEIKFSQFLLQPLGLWPLTSKHSKLEKVFSKLSVIYSAFFLLFLTVPGCLDIISAKDVKTVLKKVGPLSFNITNAIHYCLFTIHQNKVTFCLEKVLDDWQYVKNEHRESMIKSAEKARYFIIICASFMFGGGLPFCTIFPLLENSVLSENITVRNLAFPGHFLVFDEQISPFYEVVFFIQCLCTYITCSLTCGICSMMIVFVMHICAQLEIVMELLDNLIYGNPNGDFKSVDSRLASITEQHIKSLRFVIQVGKIVNEIGLVQFLSSIFGLCLIGYYIIMELESKNMTGFIVYYMLCFSYLFNIFIFCYISEQLRDQSEKVGNAAYMIKWYSLPGRKALDLILLILISSRPTNLMAGNMISFSLETFCNVLKASLAYLNMIRTLF